MRTNSTQTTYKHYRMCIEVGTENSTIRVSVNRVHVILAVVVTIAASRFCSALTIVSEEGRRSSNEEMAAGDYVQVGLIGNSLANEAES